MDDGNYRLLKGYVFCNIARNSRNYSGLDKWMRPRGYPSAAAARSYPPVPRPAPDTHGHPPEAVYACSPVSRSPNFTGKEAMDSFGILPAYTGTVVSDALCACRRHRQSRHSLCEAHPLRELTYLKETCAEQQQRTELLAKPLLAIKAEGGRARPEVTSLTKSGRRSASAATTGWWCARRD